MLHQLLSGQTGAQSPHLDPMHFLMPQTDLDTQPWTRLLNQTELLLTNKKFISREIHLKAEGTFHQVHLKYPAYVGATKINKAGSIIIKIIVEHVVLV